MTMTREQAMHCAEGLLGAFDHVSVGVALDDSVRALCKYVLSLQKGRVELTLQEFHDLVEKKEEAVTLITKTAVSLNDFLRD